MKRFIFASFAACLSWLFCLSVVHADIINILNNPSFEQPLGSGNWNDGIVDDEQKRGLSTPEVSDAPSGKRVLRISEAELMDGEFGFTFQGPFDAREGDIVSFRGQVREVFDDPDGKNEIPQLVIEFQGDFGVIQIPAGTSSPSFTTVNVSAKAPAGTQRVVFVIRLQNAETGGGTAVGEFDDVEATLSDRPILIDPRLSKNRVKRGDIAMVGMRVLNQSLEKVKEVDVVAIPSPGLSLGTGYATFDGNSIVQRNESSIIFPLGDIDGGRESMLVFPVILTNAVSPGKTYDIQFYARNPGGRVSNDARVTLKVELDPVFDQGTIIGKVFHDLNQNGVQDSGEQGVPWVRLITEEGIIVVTDEEGKYHIPAVKPGRHLVKIDGHTLPQGTKFITEESFLVKTTPGIMNKANFAVLLPPSSIPENFQKDLFVMVTQGLDTSRPALGVTMEPDVLKVGIGVLEKEPLFKFQVNYGDFVKKWFLEIRDELGQEVWAGFGVGVPPQEVVWPGMTDSGLIIKPGIYSYRFKVEDKDGHQDWTTLQFFRAISKADPRAMEKKHYEIPSVGDFNIFKDGKQSIPLVAKPTIRVQGKTKTENKVVINNLNVPVDSETGKFQAEIYTSPGEKEITVVSTTPEGEAITYRETVKVKDSVFFMVALGEEQLGVNWVDGNVALAEDNDNFKDEFYDDGRLSYYLKGKLKGKFLVKSHYDTGDERSALFRNLDPDDYYPIYGDNSTRDYDSINTQQRLYFVVEMDRSFAKWGSFETEFTDTELSTYNRTLSGLKIHYETVGTTPYGDPNRGFKLFWADSTKGRGDHNEFLATGGTLYYLRNRNVIEGSDKVRVEVRDRIQDIAISSRALVEGQDYEIDYPEGRILLSRPLSSVAATDTLISNDILDGNHVVLVVDYEFEVGFNDFDTQNRGIRGYTQVGDHLKVGGTAVEEQRLNQDYELRGVDATLKFGRNTKITAEYATSQLQQVTQGMSVNGGISFTDEGLIHGEHTRQRENAYLIKSESKPTKNLELSSYLQGVEPSFSTDRIVSQEATKKYGMAARYKLIDDFYIRYRFDSFEISDQLRPLEDNGLLAPLNATQSHIAQAVYDDGKWLAEAEYHYEDPEITGLFDPLDEITRYVLPRHRFGGRVGYHFNDRILPYVKVQVASDTPNHQFGGGVRYEVVKNIFAYIEQMVGNMGDSTYFGFEKFHENGLRTYSNMRIIDRGIGNKLLTTAIGSSFPLAEKSRIYTEREYSTYQGSDGFADILGYQGKGGDHWDFEGKFERRHLDGSRFQALNDFATLGLVRNNTSNVVSGAIAYADGQKLRARTFLEVRRDQDRPKLLQWVTRNSLEYKLTRDWSYRGWLNYGKTMFIDPDDTTADFMELSTGFAYRPVDNDRLNMLTRYTFVRNLANDFQFQNERFFGLEVDDASHILAMDLAYDLHKYVGIVEKLAYKYTIADTSLTSDVNLNNFLWAHRFNIHVTRKWDVALEYRILFQTDAVETLRQGALVEIDREFYEYARLGVGYNFTDFDDDLRKTDNYDAHGPFVRFTGKF